MYARACQRTIVTVASRVSTEQVVFPGVRRRIARVQPNTGSMPFRPSRDPVLVSAPEGSEDLGLPVGACAPFGDASGEE